MSFNIKFRESSYICTYDSALEAYKALKKAGVLYVKVETAGNTAEYEVDDFTFAIALRNNVGLMIIYQI